MPILVLLAAGITLCICINVIGGWQHRSASGKGRLGEEVEFDEAERISGAQDRFHSKFDSASDASWGDDQEQALIDRGIVGVSQKPISAWSDQAQLARRSWEMEQHNSEAERAADLHDAAMADAMRKGGEVGATAAIVDGEPQDKMRAEKAKDVWGVSEKYKDLLALQQVRHGAGPPTPPSPPPAPPSPPTPPSPPDKPSAPSPPPTPPLAPEPGRNQTDWPLW